MLRRVILLAAFLTAPMLAAPSEPSPAQLRHLAQACTAEEAFGLRFAQKMPAGAIAAPEWAPVQVLSPRLASGRLVGVEATASFEKALMSTEDRVALARWVLRAVDKEILSGRNFAQRRPRPDGVSYRAASGFTFEISQDGAVLHLSCAARSVQP